MDTSGVRTGLRAEDDVGVVGAVDGAVGGDLRHLQLIDVGELRRLRHGRPRHARQFLRAPHENWVQKGDFQQPAGPHSKGTQGTGAACPAFRTLEEALALWETVVAQPSMGLAVCATSWHKSIGLKGLAELSCMQRSVSIRVAPEEAMVGYERTCISQ